ncbi:FtsX-like permease family protein [Piscinibacter sp. XHJ-5]|uniref:ABC transporter permease n=1 Tax=Piscinibacter sp. XHJ-5 TaxID=3037797 RepID=UPI00245296B8|nr:FtsX-like permease family protein [Piscinibacter sp. XHJ-5]
MRTLSLALRNLLRNRRRSLMTLFAMVIGLVAVLLFGGYIRDINYALQSDFVRLTGHLQIQHKNYFLYGSGNPAAYGIRDYERLIALVKKDPVLAPMVLVATPTLQFGGIAGNFAAGVSRTIYASGTIAEDQNRMRQWNAYGLRMLSRPLTLAGTPPDSAVIGTGVARVLQLCGPLKVPNCVSAPAAGAPAQAAALPDDIAALAAGQAAPAAASAASAPARIEILATNVHGAPNVAAVNVLRAEFQGIKELDEVYVALHLAQAQKLIFGAAQPQVTAIALQLHRTADLPAARARLEALLASTAKAQPLEVIDYETLNPFYGQTLAMFSAIFGFISVLIGGIVLFTVSNTMSMAVVERTAEIGTLRAIGLRRGGIRTLFVIEGMVLGVMGALLGIVVAILAGWAINAMGITWTPPGRISPVALAVRVASEPLMIMASTIGLVIVAALSAILPAARAARMNIVDALRHV